MMENHESPNYLKGSGPAEESYSSSPEDNAEASTSEGTQALIRIYPPPSLLVTRPTAEIKERR
jgi:hypothetical protein